MSIPEFVKPRVKEYYWNNDLNCATVTLKNLAEFFDVDLDGQVIDAALGMHGAGGYRAQCGLVEGTLLFLGIIGRKNQIADEEIIGLCKAFAEQFESRFSSLQCRILRPEGFSPENKPHLCENLTCISNEFSINFITTHL